MWNNHCYDNTMILIHIILYNTNDNDHERILLHGVTCCTKKTTATLATCTTVYIYTHYIITILINKTIPVHII